MLYAENTTRTHKDVRANSSISTLRPPYYPFLEERAELWVIDAAVVGDGAKTLLESGAVCRKYASNPEQNKFTLFL